MSWSVPGRWLRATQERTDLTNEEVLARGEAAERTLASMAFVDCWNTLSNFHVAAICASPPEAAQAREHHYTMIQALKEIEADLREWVAMAEALRSDIEHEDTPTE
jgi:hypothetical protein